MPVVIVAGADDGVVDPKAHSVRLHHDLEQSSLSVIPSTGHMVHYAMQNELVALIDAHFGASAFARADKPQPTESEAEATTT